MTIRTIMSSRERTTELNSAELIGDVLAPEGSRKWCVGMRHRIHELITQHHTDHERLRDCVEWFTKLEGWKGLEDSRKQQFRNYSQFCKEKWPYGLGRDAGEIDALLKEGAAKQTAQAKAADPEVKPSPANGEIGRGRNSCDDGTPNRVRGSNSSEYLVRRLKRDAPDIAQALANGQYPSARAAGIAAGIVKVPTPLKLLIRAWSKASNKEKDAFIKWTEENGFKLTEKHHE